MYYGYGYVYININIKIYHYVADVGICFLLTMFAVGFGVSFSNIDDPKFKNQLLKVGGVVIFVKYIWAFIAAFLNRKRTGYHDYEGWLGRFEIMGSF